MHQILISSAKSKKDFVWAAKNYGETFPNISLPCFLLGQMLPKNTFLVEAKLFASGIIFWNPKAVGNTTEKHISKQKKNMIQMLHGTGIFTQPFTIKIQPFM